MDAKKMKYIQAIMMVPELFENPSVSFKTVNGEISSLEIKIPLPDFMIADSIIIKRWANSETFTVWPIFGDINTTDILGVLNLVKAKVDEIDSLRERAEKLRGIIGENIKLSIDVRTWPKSPPNIQAGELFEYKGKNYAGPMVWNKMI